VPCKPLWLTLPLR